MSWSITAEGTPSQVAEALQQHSGAISGQSKIEFDDALSHLTALVNQNFENRDGREPQKPKINAYGSGSSSGDQQLERSCSVTLTRG